MSVTYDENLVGQVFNIQRYSTHDGPGVRTTVFLKGCPLRCYWCQNPESQSLKPVLMIKKDRCTGCGRCIQACPQKANHLENGIVVTDRSLCTVCGRCVKACLNKVRTVEGEPMTIKQVIDKVKRDYNLFCNSGGGMTISGGACEMQPEFTVNLLKAAHEEGISTAVEMEGAFPWETIEAIAKHSDFIMYDLKHMDSEKHKMGTKVSNERILDNAKRLVKMGKKIKFRTPLIPGFNDSKESVAAIAHFIRDELGLSPAECHELLKYNNLGEDKYERLDMHGICPKNERQSEEYLAELNAIRESI